MAEKRHNPISFSDNNATGYRKENKLQNTCGNTATNEIGTRQKFGYDSIFAKKS
jgi:hypothetical protein